MTKLILSISAAAAAAAAPRTKAKSAVTAKVATQRAKAKTNTAAKYQKLTALTVAQRSKVTAAIEGLLQSITGTYQSGQKFTGATATVTSAGNVKLAIGKYTGLLDVEVKITERGAVTDLRIDNKVIKLSGSKVAQRQALTKAVYSAKKWPSPAAQALGAAGKAVAAAILQASDLTDNERSKVLGLFKKALGSNTFTDKVVGTSIELTASHNGIESSKIAIYIHRIIVAGGRMQSVTYSVGSKRSSKYESTLTLSSLRTQIDKILG